MHNPAPQRRRQWPLVLILGNLLFMAMVHGLPEVSAADSPLEPSAMAWSEPIESGWEIFVARFSSGRWESPIQVSANGLRNLIPSAVTAEDGNVHIVWSSQDGGRFQLNHARLLTDGPTEPETLVTLLDNDMAPSALIDSQGTVWMVWSGYDGSDDDIFFSRWMGANWDPPIRVNSDDYSPDIQPLLGLGADGFPWVVWRGFENGAYRPFYSRWNGADWVEEDVLENDHPYFTQIKGQFLTMPEPPPDALHPDKGSMNVQRAPIQSLPLYMEKQFTETP